MKLFLMLTFILLPKFSFAYEDVLQARPGVYGSSKNVNCPIIVVPSKGIGPMELGRHLKEIEGLGMEIKTVQGSQTHMIVGKYTIGVTDQGRLRYVQAELGDLPKCVYFGKSKLTHKMTLQKLAEIFPNCKKEQLNKGGTIVECDGISISSGGWGGQQKTPALKIMAK